MSDSTSLPPEFDLPPAHGFTMNGWNFSRAEVSAALSQHRMLNPAMELGSNVCPWNCDFCFTESPLNREGTKRRLTGELPISRRLRLIEEAADLGARSINFVGAGEPTIDPSFWDVVEQMNKVNITPIIYTEGTLRLGRRSFAEKLFDLGATVVLKVNSLTNADYQDRVVRGIKPKPGIPTLSYTSERQKVLDLLLDIGFANSSPTRLAFDTIICRENFDEIEDLHRFTRMRNIFLLLVNYLPSGRTKDGHTTAVTWAQQQAVFSRLAEIDRSEFGIHHATTFPYAGGVPCTIRGLGLFTKIQGQVYDCPGEAVSLGNLNEDSLQAVWEKARAITRAFDGGCFPRQQFWKRMASMAEIPTSTDNLDFSARNETQ